MSHRHFIRQNLSPRLHQDFLPGPHPWDILLESLFRYFFLFPFSFIEHLPLDDPEALFDQVVFSFEKHT